MYIIKGYLGMTDKDKGENGANYNGYDVDSPSNHGRSIDDLIRLVQRQRSNFRNLPGMVQQLQENNELQIELINKLVQERRELALQNKKLSEEKIMLTRKMEKQSKETNDLRTEVLNLKRQINTLQFNIPSPQSDWKQSTSIMSYHTSPRKQRIFELPKKKPQVRVYFFSPQRDQVPPIMDITSRLTEALSQQDVVLVTETITETPVPDDARPAILLCINVSRIGTDVTNALKDMKADYNVAVVVLHHKDIHVLPKLSSVKSLTGREFQNLGAIVDMAFWKEKGLHQCDMNQQAIQKLCEFLKMFVLPGK